jgi:transposase
MTYSIDLRERAVSFVHTGGSQAEASQLFKVSTRTLYNWLQSKDLTPKKHGLRKRKLDKAALAADIRDHPDAYLRERAARFGVSGVAIFKALRQMKIVKKNDDLR